MSQVQSQDNGGKKRLPMRIDGLANFNDNKDIVITFTFPDHADRPMITSDVSNTTTAANGNATANANATAGANGNSTNKLHQCLVLTELFIDIDQAIWMKLLMPQPSLAHLMIPNNGEYGH